MKKLGEADVEFPETKDEVNTWKPLVIRRPLAPRVLAVARTRIEGAWGAYIDAVPGVSHRDEQAAVLKHGTKLPEEWARPLFPVFDGVPYAR